MAGRSRGQAGSARPGVFPPLSVHKKVAAAPPSPSPAASPLPASLRAEKKDVTKCTKKFRLQHTDQLLSRSTAGAGSVGSTRRDALPAVSTLPLDGSLRGWAARHLAGQASGPPAPPSAASVPGTRGGRPGEGVGSRCEASPCRRRATQDFTDNLDRRLQFWGDLGQGREGSRRPDVA